MTIKQMINKSKYVYGYVSTSEHDGMYLRLNKADVVAMYNNRYLKESFDIDKFDLRQDKQGDTNLYIN
mgnify:CR=1 FL=1|tara:strand:- start:1493 stop:1696 length:204 start_codon:yes stop_codon:yes gene_type:complete